MVTRTIRDQVKDLILIQVRTLLGPESEYDRCIRTVNVM